MKFRLSNRRSDALTMIEVLVIMAVLIVLVFAFWPCSPSMKRKAQRITCLNNLKQIGVAMRNFADTHNGKFPMEVSVTAGGTREIAGFGVVGPHFLVLSNALSEQRVLHCPFDHRPMATIIELFVI